MTPSCSLHMSCVGCSNALQLTMACCAAEEQACGVAQSL